MCAIQSKADLTKTVDVEEKKNDAPKRIEGVFHSMKPVPRVRMALLIVSPHLLIIKQKTKD